LILKDSSLRHLLNKESGVLNAKAETSKGTDLNRTLLRKMKENGVSCTPTQKVGAAAAYKDKSRLDWTCFPIKSLCQLGELCSLDGVLSRLQEISQLSLALKQEELARGDLNHASLFERVFMMRKSPKPTWMGRIVPGDKINQALRNPVDQLSRSRDGTIDPLQDTPLLNPQGCCHRSQGVSLWEADLSIQLNHQATGLKEGLSKPRRVQGLSRFMEVKGFLGEEFQIDREICLLQEDPKRFSLLFYKTITSGDMV